MPNIKPPVAVRAVHEVDEGIAKPVVWMGGWQFEHLTSCDVVTLDGFLTTLARDVIANVFGCRAYESVACDRKRRSSRGRGESGFQKRPAREGGFRFWHRFSW